MKKTLLITCMFITYIGFSQCVEPVITDFECSSPSNPISGALVTIANPFPGGINTSANVGEYTDNNMDGFDALLVNYSAPIDLSTNSLLKIKFYSSQSVQILAKLEGGTATQDKFSPFSAVNTWEEFTFDFSAEALDGNTTVVLFFNPGFTGGSGTDTYYIDDLRFEAPPAPCNEPVVTDFECASPSATIIGALTTVPNSVSGGINTSPNIGEYTDDGTQGFDNLTIDFGSAIDLSTNKFFKLRFYSPTTSVQIVAQLQGGTTPSAEIFSPFSAIGTWEDYVFDFTGNEAGGNTRLVLFFNFGATNGTPTDTYFVDGLRFDSASTLSTNGVTSDNKLSLYPNPTSDIINITSSEKIDSYQIINVMGKTVSSSYSENISNTIDVSALKSGIYFMRIQTETTNSALRFVKE